MPELPPPPLSDHSHLMGIAHRPTTAKDGFRTQGLIAERGHADCVKQIAPSPSLTETAAGTTTSTTNSAPSIATTRAPRRLGLVMRARPTCGQCNGQARAVRALDRAARWAQEGTSPAQVWRSCSSRHRRRCVRSMIRKHGKCSRAGRLEMATVLIVDDAPDTLDLCTELLESAGHRVQTGRNGQEGLKSLADGPLPDCVLLDVEMPILSGPQMAHQMLLHDAGEERIPILLVSARGDLPEIARRIGTPYFLAKATPNYGKALLRILALALTERRAPEARAAVGIELQE